MALVEPPMVSILGRPNVGKSSLFNALFGVDRTIVTPEPGTTRDCVEAVVSFEELAVVLADTAGLAPFEREVDRAAVERSWASVEQSRAALYCVEVGREPSAEEHRLMERVRGRVETILVRTKGDLAEGAPPGEGLKVSAATGEGLEELEGAVLDALFGEWRTFAGGPLVFTAEQAESLGRAAALVGPEREGEEDRRLTEAAAVLRAATSG
jgi:tRNA modification GTPase